MGRVRSPCGRHSHDGTNGAYVVVAYLTVNEGTGATYVGYSCSADTGATFTPHPHAVTLQAGVSCSSYNGNSSTCRRSRYAGDRRQFHLRQPGAMGHGSCLRLPDGGRLRRVTGCTWSSYCARDMRRLHRVRLGHL